MESTKSQLERLKKSYIELKIKHENLVRIHKIMLEKLNKYNLISVLKNCLRKEIEGGKA